MLAGVDRLVTVPLGGLLRRGVSEADVLRAGDELVARAVARLMTPEGWKVPESQGKRKQQRLLKPALSSGPRLQRLPASLDAMVSLSL